MAQKLHRAAPSPLSIPRIDRAWNLAAETFADQSRITVKQLCNSSATALQPLCNRSETALKQLGWCTETALKLLC